MGDFKEVSVLVVYAICTVTVNFGKERLHVQAGRIRIYLDCGFVKPRLNLV